MGVCLARQFKAFSSQDWCHCFCTGLLPVPHGHWKHCLPSSAEDTAGAQIDHRVSIIALSLNTLLNFCLQPSSHLVWSCCPSARLVPALGWASFLRFPIGGICPACGRARNNIDRIYRYVAGIMKVVHC